MKHKGRIVVIVIILLLSVFCIKKIYTITREEYKIINYVLKGYKKYFKVVNIDRNDETKECRFYIYKKYKKNDCNFKAYGDIQSRVDEYLENQSKYFLNKGYRISMSFSTNRKGMPVYLSMKNYINSGKFQVKFDKLNVIHASTFITDVFEDYTILSYLNDVEVIRLDRVSMNALQSISEYNDLKYIFSNEKIAYKEREFIKERWPECEIID